MSTTNAKSPSGSNDAAVNSATLHAQMRGNGLNQEKAAKYSSYLQDMSDYIQKHPDLQTALKGTKDSYDVYKGAKAAKVAAGYTGSLNALIKDYGSSGGASVLGVFVDRFGAMAKNQGIELNECALLVSKVALDIGGVGVGSVSSVSGVGLLLLGASIVATYQDSYSLARACINTQ